jgi:hypothetical protein
MAFAALQHERDVSGARRENGQGSNGQRGDERDSTHHKRAPSWIGI